MAQIERSDGARLRCSLMMKQHPSLVVAATLVVGLMGGAAVYGAVLASSGEEVWVERRSDADVGEDASEADGDELGSVDGGREASDSLGSDAGPDGAGELGEQGPEQEEELVVDVAGAVARPCVVTLREGDRVRDAIDAAGGLAPDAEASGVNQAAKLVDGQQVYVPRAGEPDGSGAGGTSDGGAADALVNINTAGIDELDSLNGVGPSTAQAIVEDREANGPFTAIEDVMRVNGIGEKKFEQLKSDICV